MNEYGNAMPDPMRSANSKVVQMAQIKSCCLVGPLLDPL